VDDNVSKTINANQKAFFKEHRHLKPTSRVWNILKWVGIAIVVIVVVVVAWKVGLIALIAKGVMAIGGALLAGGKALVAGGKALVLALKGVKWAALGGKVIAGAKVVGGKVYAGLKLIGQINFALKVGQLLGAWDIGRITDLYKGNNPVIKFLLGTVNIATLFVSVKELHNLVTSLHSLKHMGSTLYIFAVQNPGWTGIWTIAETVDGIISLPGDFWNDLILPAAGLISTPPKITIPALSRINLPSLAFVIPKQNFAFAA
jgi:hypothetical protein